MATIQTDFDGYHRAMRLMLRENTFVQRAVVNHFANIARDDLYETSVAKMSFKRSPSNVMKGRGGLDRNYAKRGKNEATISSSRAFIGHHQIEKGKFGSSRGYIYNGQSYLVIPSRTASGRKVKQSDSATTFVIRAKSGALLLMQRTDTKSAQKKRSQRKERTGKYRDNSRKFGYRQRGSSRTDKHGTRKDAGVKQIGVLVLLADKAGRLPWQQVTDRIVAENKDRLWAIEMEKAAAKTIEKGRRF